LPSEFVTILGNLPIPHDASGVVHQHIDRRIMLHQLRRKDAYLTQPGEIAAEIRCFEFICGGARLFRRPADDDDGIAGRGQRSGGCESDAVTGAGDDDRLAHRVPPESALPCARNLTSRRVRRGVHRLTEPIG
jgi:hypothetical protein